MIRVVLLFVDNVNIVKKCNLILLIIICVTAIN